MKKMKCPKCSKGITKIIFTGKGKEDYCYYCYTCEDRIAKEAIVLLSKQKHTK